MNNEDLSTLIETIKSALDTSDYKASSKNFNEDDASYTGQFIKVYEGLSIHGECHYITYARFSVTQDSHVVRHVTRFDKSSVTDPIETLTQHISLGPKDLEGLFIGYLEWTMLKQGKEATNA